jgi:SAM-dependent methyltransferase
VADLAQYNRDTYDRIWGLARVHPPERTPWWPVLSELALTAPNRLEVGPGMWPRLPTQGTHVVDLSAAVERLREHGAIVHQGLLHEVAFPAASFDMVGIFEVLEHVDRDVHLLSELARITKPGGILAASVPLAMRYWTQWDEFAGHVRRYEPSELREKLADAGFTIERFEVRPSGMSRFGAAVFAPIFRWFPRFSVWVTENVFLPAACRQKLEWMNADQWEERSGVAGECSLVCRRR